MSLVHWSPNLSVGDTVIDSEHRALIELLNDLASAVETGSGHKAIADKLDRLIAETEKHFRSEEEIMARERYPELDHHRRLHQALLEEVGDFRDGLVRGMAMGPEVTEFIRNWLVSHIMESDKQLGGYLQGRR